MIKSVEWTDAGVVLLDQRLLPAKEVYQTCTGYQEVADAIRSMVIRGAPAIGIAAAMGIALGVRRSHATTPEQLDAEFESFCSLMASLRPTEISLFRAADRMRAAYSRARSAGLESLRSALAAEAESIRREDFLANIELGRLGQDLVPMEARILTHCNTGSLATSGFGTALGVIRTAAANGKRVQVFASETRPLLQGARLTAWELQREKIPVTLITDNMAGHFMQRGRIDCVLVGADRIAANGDVANKIGTYSIAVLAKEHGVPFYVAASVSTLDMSVSDGSHIPIEMRDPDEVRRIGGILIAPENVKVENPAFDVTPHRYISAIITDKGVALPPFAESLPELAGCSLQNGFKGS